MPLALVCVIMRKIFYKKQVQIVSFNIFKSCNIFIIKMPNIQVINYNPAAFRSIKNFICGSLSANFKAIFRPGLKIGWLLEKIKLRA